MRPLFLCCALPLAISSETLTACGQAISQRWQPMQYSTHSLSLSTPSRRKRSMSGPNPFGPGKGGYTFNTGHAALQSEHFTQLSSFRSAFCILHSLLTRQHARLISAYDGDCVPVTRVEFPQNASAWEDVFRQHCATFQQMREFA